jgi:hypothetical protein
MWDPTNMIETTATSTCDDYYVNALVVAASRTESRRPDAGVAGHQGGQLGTELPYRTVARPYTNVAAVTAQDPGSCLPAHRVHVIPATRHGRPPSRSTTVVGPLLSTTRTQHAYLTVAARTGTAGWSGREGASSS